MMVDQLILTCQKMYLITNEELSKQNINIKDYLKNKGDSLKLKRNILTEINKKKYPYVIDMDIKIDKTLCKNRLCSKLFYEKFNEEYEYKNIKN